MPYGEKAFPTQSIMEIKTKPMKVQRAAPKKNWIKQIQNDIKNRRITLEKSRKIALSREEWRGFLMNITGPIAPTTVYWLRGQPRP